MKAVIGVALLAVCVFGQTIEKLPMDKMGLLMGNSALMTENTGMKTWTGDFDQVLNFQELIQHPLFQVYYQIPLFRQHFVHPLFQSFLVSPQFQQYWTNPLFLTFFQDSTLFYKVIYPQIFSTNVQTPVWPLSWTNKVQTPVMPISWTNKMIPTTTVLPTNYDELIQKVLGVEIQKNVMPTNYDELMRKVLGVENVQKNMNIQGMWMDKIMKNTFLNINKPEEIMGVKVQIPTMVNPIDKIMNEKMIEMTPMEILMKDALIKDTLVKDTLVKDSLVKDTLVNVDLNKETLLKKFILEKMMNKNVMKMTPEEFILFQNKMETLIPSRTRRHATYTQIPTTYNYNTYTKAWPYNAYTVPTTQQVYYTQPQTTFTNTVGTPYTFGNTVGTPYTFGNTVGTQFYYPTQTVV